MLLVCLQGIRPTGLSKVPTEELAQFIATCIESNRHRRPRARQLLKHPYFNTIRAEKCAIKLSSEALAHAGPSTADLQQIMADCAASLAGSISRTSSEVAEVAVALQSVDSGRVTPMGGSPVESQLQADSLEGARSAPVLPLPEVSPVQAAAAVVVPPPQQPRVSSPSRSEPGYRSGHADLDRSDSAATARTARYSFETASTAAGLMPNTEQYTSEQYISDGSHDSGIAAEPMLTGNNPFKDSILSCSSLFQRWHPCNLLQVFPQ